MLGGVAVGAGTSRGREGVRAGSAAGAVVRGALPPRELLPLPADGRVLALPLLLLLFLKLEMINIFFNSNYMVT